MATRPVPGQAEEQGEGDVREVARSLITLGAILIATAVIVAFIWWVVVLSPIGFGRAFEHTIGGDSMRTKVSGVFIIAISLAVIGGIGSASYGLWKYWRTP